MPTFTYKVRDKSGKAIKGQMEASSQELLANKLSGLGYTVVSIAPYAPAPTLRDVFFRYGRVKTDDIVMFSTQLSNMLGAGMTLPAALHVLIEQAENKMILDATTAIYEDIRAGTTFSEALSKHPKIFSNLFVNMVRAGETAGNLEEILRRLAKFAEHEAELKQKVTTALVYPMVLIVIGFVVIIFIITSVLPSFVKIFTDSHIPLPLPTRILFNVNLIIRGYWHMMLGGLAVLVVALYFYNRTPRGKMILDKLKLRIPIWGPVLRKVAIARFSRTLATLIASGVPLLQSLETTERTIDNQIIAEAIRNVYASVSKGESMAGPLKASGEFPPMPIHMIAIGEEAGGLDAMLNKVADYYDMATDYSIRRLTALLEPIFLVIIGGMVGFIFASLLLPIFRMVGTLRH